MKSFGKSVGIGFGFSAVNAGQRAVVYAPQVIATSTDGGFRITAPVSKVLNISSGENVMFLNNIDKIDAAIREGIAEIVEFCESNGLDITTPEALVAIHKEYDMWAIAKGVQEFDVRGNSKTVSERLNKNDKLRYVSNHFDEMLSSALADGEDELKDALSRDNITREEQMDLLTVGVIAKELPKFKGSRTANPAQLSGIGVPLTFTDSNVWKQLKVDLGESASSINRVYDLDLENLQDVVIDNGYDQVTAKALILESFTDEEPSRISKKD